MAIWNLIKYIFRKVISWIMDAIRVGFILMIVFMWVGVTLFWLILTGIKQGLTNIKNHFKVV